LRQRCQAWAAASGGALQEDGGAFEGFMEASCWLKPARRAVEKAASCYSGEVM
jgi:hypothetical protein